MKKITGHGVFLLWKILTKCGKMKTVVLTVLADITTTRVARKKQISD